jgi:hypothetical protein
MGLSNSKPDSNGLDYKKLRSRHLSKEEIRQNIKVLLSNSQIGQYSDTQNTLDWITDSLNLNTTQNGGNSLSESENLKKLNNFIKNLENSEEEVSENFDLYKNEVMKLEKYINQNGGYDKFEGRPLNIIYSEYLNKIPIDKYDPDVDVDESDVSELQMNNKNKNILKGGDMSETSESTYVLTSDKKNMKELYNNEISTLENYIKQNGGYEAFEGRLLNIVNSKVLEKINYEEEDTETENSLSTINFTEQNGGCPCDSQKQVFMKNTNQNGAGLNTISATSINSINLKNNNNLSATSNSSIISGQKGGANTISATSMNSINLKNNTLLSATSDSSKISRASKQNGGKVFSLNTLSETSLNSKLNMNELPRFSETSFSENVLNGGAREENKETRNKKDRKERRRKDESSTTTNETTDEEDIDLDESEDSDETSSEDIMNDEDTESSDDTVKMARMIARQRLVSESAEGSSSTTTDSEEETSDVSSSDDSSETSDADTSTESEDSRKMSRSKVKKSNKKTTKKTSKKTSKGKKSKKMSRTTTENGLSESTEFRAVPFYSSENSTSFYRNYQNKNRFN